jgi:lysophospholipase L1-like esterase
MSLRRKVGTSRAMTLVSVLALGFGLAAAGAPARAGLVTGPATWVDAWAAAPISSAAEPAPVPVFTNQTVRLITHLHAGGTSVRIRLANTFGDRDVRFGKVTVGVRASGATVTSPRSATFAGKPSATVARGAEISTDPVPLAVSAGQDLAVSVFLPASTGPATWHRSALQTSYVSTAGDHTAEAGSAAFTTSVSHWFFLDAVSVSSTTAPATIVALGDSITDGSGSPGNSNQRWPDLLYARLAARAGGGGPVESVVDEGVAGNKVLTDDPRSGDSALHRLTRDVLVRRGLRQVVLLEGVNDLRDPARQANADQIIAGYRQIIDRVHAKNAKIFGATLTPVEGSARYTPVMETERQKLNTWIRTSHAFDGVVDFDRATQDPAHPLRYLPAYDSGDHLHPNAAGYHAMAAAIDLSLFD